MRILILLLVFPHFLFSQKIKFQKSDTIYLGNSVYPTCMLKMSNSSATDPAMIFVIPIKDFGKLQRKIEKFYVTKKQEYDEYYILGVPDITKNKLVSQVLTLYLQQIDSARMARNRSTFLRNYSWDKVNYKISYQSTFKDLNSVDNLHYLNSTEEVCKYIRCSALDASQKFNN
ncbi:MAG: hypothetical protein ABI267_04160 [Ginsengibacter sp.]